MNAANNFSEKAKTNIS